MAAAAALLRAGAVVAVKGIGGYHLACRADAEAAVAALRARKRREERPFALMAGGLDAARALVVLDAAAAARLTARDRPIVIAPRAPGAAVADAVAPGLRELGVMLPYSPLHHLLLGDVGVPLVLTSGNVSDEPIAFADDDARERLGGIADAFLVHDRPIETRTDDSVVRGPLVLRRSRGRVPDSLPLPVVAAAPVLACGAELKSTFCLAKGGRAWVGHHVGDLKNWETLASYRAGIDHFERLFAVAPAVVAHDLHPDYLSTGYALGAGRRRARRRPAPPRAPRGGARRARRDRPGGGRDLRRRGARDGRHGLGRRAARRRPGGAASAPGTSGRCGSRAATRRRASRGGWRARGSARRPPRRRPRSRRSTPRAAPRSPGCCAAGPRRRSPRAPGGCSTPSPRSAACAPR